VPIHQAEEDEMSKTLKQMTDFLIRAGVDPNGYGEKLPKVVELGTCDWCSKVVYSNQQHETGRNGEGLMHTNLSDCEEERK